MKIKICGLTTEKEADYLNTYGADYAGFVFYGKSKRAITLPKALSVMSRLKDTIQRVAVLVSPVAEDIDELQKSGFHILQIHGKLQQEVLEEASLPIWYAVNVANEEVLRQHLMYLQNLPEHMSRKIKGIVVDGAGYGEGVTFDWEMPLGKSGEMKSLLDGRKFILAGGLNAKNVNRGIQIFSPDVVDVSSGVEYEDFAHKDTRKSPEKIMQFIREVRNYE